MIMTTSDGYYLFMESGNYGENIFQKGRSMNVNRMREQKVVTVFANRLFQPGASLCSLAVAQPIAFGFSCPAILT